MLLNKVNRSMARSLMRILALPAFLILAGASPAAVQRGADETPAHFVARVLDRPEDELQVLDTRWNGHRAIFADYLTRQKLKEGYEIAKRRVVVLLQDDDSSWHPVTVADIDEEGGIPEIVAIGFANADKDAAQELIVLIKWQQVHYDYGGAFYEVHLYDTPKAGQSALPYLAETSKLFGGIACECMYRDGRESTEAPFATIAAIKHKLVQSGY
jgi:hypothetical protein